ncbi:MAG TPA: YcxB family protein [Candidatus Andersenbacteria bacterium]|nr:YcxB family protein [Candidatus Andersenbacteria bacterium]
MTITYAITVDDLLAFNIYSQSRRSILKRYFPIFGFFALIAMLPAILFGDFSNSIIALASLFFVILAIIYGMKHPRRVALFCASLVILYAGLVSFFSDIDLVPLFFEILPITLPLCFINVWNFYWRRMIKSFYTGRTDMVGEHTLTIDENGLHLKSEQSEGSHTWRVVEAIEQSEKYLFIFLGKLSAHVIPKSSFNSPNAARVFYEKSFSLWKGTDVDKQV